MKLYHYQQLYNHTAVRELSEKSKDELITEVLKRFTIKDWKEIERIQQQTETDEKGEGS